MTVRPTTYAVFCWLILAAVVLPLHLPAVSGFQAGDYLVENWRVSDGLPIDNVFCFTQTPDGYLWIGTYAGLVRFDGLEFEVMESPSAPRLKNSLVWSLFAGQDGELWAGTFYGIARYREGEFIFYNQAHGLPPGKIARISGGAGGGIVAGITNQYRYTFEKDTFKPLPPPLGLSRDDIIQSFELPGGETWFNTVSRGLLKKSGDILKGEPLNIPGTEIQVRQIIRDHAGNTWVATNKGLVEISGGKRNLYTTADSGLVHNNIFDILEDGEHNLWVGTGSGLCLVTRGTGGGLRFQTLLENEYIQCIARDRENNIWIGTDGSGIMRLRKPMIRTYSREQGLDNMYVRCLHQDEDDVIWVGTNDRLYRFDGRRFIPVPIASGTLKNAITSDNNGNLWIGTGSGLLKIQGKEEELFTREHGLPSNLVHALYTDSRDRIWIGTSAGIARYDGGTFSPFSGTGELQGALVRFIYEDSSSNIWVTTKKGIFRLEKGKLDGEGVQSYLAGEPCTFVLEDNTDAGRFWFGTYDRGLWVSDSGTLTNIDHRHGLIKGEFYRVVEDGSGYFWMNSNKGLLRVRKKELEQLVQEKIDWVTCTPFGIGDGMLSVESYFSPGGTLLRTRDGELWTATKKGISVVVPSVVRVPEGAPEVLIKDVLLDGRSLIDKVEAKFLRSGWRRDLEIRFTAPNFTAPEYIRFKYRLEGVDEGWVIPSLEDERRARYRDISPGSYRFRVIGCNRDGVWNGAGAVLSIRLAAPFFKSIWIKLILAVILMLLFARVFLWFGKTYKRRPERYQGAVLDPKRTAWVLQILNRLMEVEKIYLEEDLSIKDLADKLHVSVHFVSQLLNEKVGQTFYDYVNQYRINDVKDRLVDPEQSEISILDIANECGFSSKTSFNRYFKRYTGMTPSQFRRKGGG